MEGFLKKRSMYVRRWSKRYFRLRGNILTYWIPSGNHRGHWDALKKRGSWKLGSDCRCQKSKARKNSFQVYLGSKAIPKAIVLQAADDFTLNRWMRAITDVIRSENSPSRTLFKEPAAVASASPQNTRQENSAYDLDLNDNDASLLDLYTPQTSPSNGKILHNDALSTTNLISDIDSINQFPGATFKVVWSGSAGVDYRESYQGEKIAPSVDYAPTNTTVEAAEIVGKWIRTVENKWLPIELPRLGVLLEKVVVTPIEDENVTSATIQNASKLAALRKMRATLLAANAATVISQTIVGKAKQRNRLQLRVDLARARAGQAIRGSNSENNSNNGNGGSGFTFKMAPIALNAPLINRRPASPAMRSPRTRFMMAEQRRVINPQQSDVRRYRARVHGGVTDESMRKSNDENRVHGLQKRLDEVDQLVRTNRLRSNSAAARALHNIGLDSSFDDASTPPSGFK
eukprot:g241.t1